MPILNFPCGFIEHGCKAFQIQADPSNSDIVVQTAVVAHQIFTHMNIKTAGAHFLLGETRATQPIIMKCIKKLIMKHNNLYTLLTSELL